MCVTTLGAVLATNNSQSLMGSLRRMQNTHSRLLRRMVKYITAGKSY